MRAPPGLLLLLAAACGAAGAPPPAAAPAAAPLAAAPAPAPAAVSCADAGVLLRGHVEDQRLAAPAKEAIIARTCHYEKWAPDLLRCVGTEAAPRECLEQLSPAQRGAYDAALVAWNESFPDEYLEDPHTHDGIDGDMDYIDCSDAVKDLASYAPAVSLTGDERTYVVAMREAAVLELCEDWDYDQRLCFRDASPQEIASCRRGLAPVQALALDGKLADIDRIGAKMGALKRTPAAAGCKQAVAAHYADAAWRGKAQAVTGVERTRMVAESRARMAQACTADKWPPAMRACIIAGGGDACFPGGTARAWGFPARGVAVRSGIPECDAYAETTKRLLGCQAIPASSRDALRRTWETLAASWASISPASHAPMAAACRRADEALRSAATSAGCAP